MTPPDNKFSNAVFSTLNQVSGRITPERVGLETRPAEGTPELAEWTHDGDTVCDYVATALQPATGSIAALIHRLNDATKPVDAADRNLIIRALQASRK